MQEQVKPSVVQVSPAGHIPLLQAGKLAPQGRGLKHAQSVPLLKQNPPSGHTPLHAGKVSPQEGGGDGGGEGMMDPAVSGGVLGAVYGENRSRNIAITSTAIIDVIMIDRLCRFEKTWDSILF